MAAPRAAADSSLELGAVGGYAQLLEGEGLARGGGESHPPRATPVAGRDERERGEREREAERADGVGGERLERPKEEGVEAVGRPLTSPAERLRALRVPLAVCAWFVASIGVTYMFKFLLSARGLRAPFFLVGVTNVLVSALAFGLSRVPQLRPPAVTASRFLRIILPIGIGTTLDISFSNWSLAYVSVAYHVVLKGTVPLFVLLFSVILRLERVRGLVTPVAIVAIVLGISLASLDPSDAKMHGATHAVAGSVTVIPAGSARPNGELEDGIESSEKGIPALGRRLLVEVSRRLTEPLTSGVDEGEGGEPVRNRPLGLFLGMLSSCFAGQRWAFTQLLMQGRLVRDSDGIKPTAATPGASSPAHEAPLRKAMGPVGTLLYTAPTIALGALSCSAALEVSVPLCGNLLAGMQISVFATSLRCEIVMLDLWMHLGLRSICTPVATAPCLLLV